jgi:hypothetical protein
MRLPVARIGDAMTGKLAAIVFEAAHERSPECLSLLVRGSKVL